LLPLLLLLAFSLLALPAFVPADGSEVGFVVQLFVLVSVDDLEGSEVGDGEVVVEFEEVVGVAYFEAVPDGLLVLLTAEVEEGSGGVDVEVVALSNRVFDVITLDSGLEEVRLLLGRGFATAAAVLALFGGGPLATADLLTVSSSEDQSFVQVQKESFLEEEEKAVDAAAVDVETVVKLFQRLPAVSLLPRPRPLQQALQKSSENV
jgi:hypothetical protein